MFQKSFGSGYGIPDDVWSTHCILSKRFFGILFAADFSIGASYKITPSALGWKKQVKLFTLEPVIYSHVLAPKILVVNDRLSQNTG